MSDDTRARAALIEAAKDFLTVVTSIATTTETVADLPTMVADHVAWENSRFNEESKEFWAAVFYRPNIPNGVTVGQGGKDLLTGFLQIDFNGPTNRGEGAHLEWERKARLYFPAGRAFNYGGQSVLVNQAGMSQSRVIGSNFRKSLTVAFRAHLTRPILTN